MIIENKEMGIRFEVDNQQDFDKWYAIRKEQIRADAIEVLKEACAEKMAEISKEYFRIAKGHVMPERRTYIKMADVMGTAIEIVLIKAEQLKEKKE